IKKKTVAEKEVRALSKKEEGRLVDESPHTLIFEFSGDNERILSVLESLKKKNGFLEIARTGDVALEKGSNVLAAGGRK
ncbi:MAG: acetolactate synthase small subunit, partial [bacterium]|nr:acetolactate synthase small subunit [bacterium]